jgi:hypothetical protein
MPIILQKSHCPKTQKIDMRSDTHINVLMSVMLSGDLLIPALLVEGQRR